MGGHGDGGDSSEQHTISLGNSLATVGLFKGGLGDGSATGQTSDAVLNGDADLGVLFVGGSSDGGAHALLFGALLNGDTLSDIYSSGIGDGFGGGEAGGAAFGSLLSGNSIHVLYLGGEGDGAASKLESGSGLNQKLNDHMWFGGTGDGQSYSTTRLSLSGFSTEILYFGGSGDGVDVSQKPSQLLEQAADFDGDFLVDVVDPDDDNDQMPDDWEREHELNPLDSADAAMDMDGDGQDAVSEYIADTDPRNIHSVFKIQFVQTQLGLEIHFDSSAERIYQLFRVGSLPSNNWLPDSPGFFGVNGPDSILPTLPESGAWFYRLEVKLP